MFKTLFNYILWQRSIKPIKWYHFLMTIFYWLLVIFMEMILIIGVPQLSQKGNFPQFLTTIWVIFGAINLLFTGVILENNMYSFLAVSFLGLPKAIVKAKRRINRLFYSCQLLVN